MFPVIYILEENELTYPLRLMNRLMDTVSVIYFKQTFLFEVLEYDLVTIIFHL